MLGVGTGPPCRPDQAEPAPSTTARPTPPIPARQRPADAARREREAWAVLAGVDGLGPAGMAARLAALGDGVAVLATAGGASATAHLVQAAASRGHRLPVEAAARVVDAAAGAPAFMARVRALGLTVVTLAESAYPARLRRIEQPPPVLFVRGDATALERVHAVAIVGTRRPTERGRRIGAAIGGAVAQAGAVVVSGLAVGVDGVAHEAAVDVGGCTVAVLGGGHGRLYPRAHGRLAERIAARGGAVISELAPDVPPVAGTFPRRNRVISGLSDATVVVEARARSGALITAGWALEQGRPCFVVPGPIDVEQSLGCNRLLRLYPGEARAVSSIEELIEDLGLAADELDAADATATAPLRDARAASPPNRSSGSLPGASSAAALAALSGPERAVARAMLAGPVTLDELVAATSLAPAAVLVILTRLEDRGHVAAVLGRYVTAGPLASAPLVIHREP